MIGRQPFGVPLDRPRREATSPFDGFDDAGWRAADHLQFRGHPVRGDGLVMRAVDRGHDGKSVSHPRGSLDVDVVCGVLAVVGPMRLGLRNPADAGEEPGHVLDQASAESHVENLDAPADAEDRLSHPQ